MGGLDETQGTRDDYKLVLEYVGVDAGADILGRFDRKTGFAAARVSTKGLSKNHRVMTAGRIVNYNPNISSKRSWYFPVLEPLATGIKELNYRAISIRIDTEKGKRYAIIWPADHLKKDERAEQILIQIQGKNTTPSNGTTFFFIADQEHTQVKIAFPERAPDSSKMVIGKMVAKPLK